MTRRDAAGARERDRPRYPDFYLVGAPRSGTTWMFDALGRHPGIFVPANKEPHFFAADLDSGTYLDSRFFVRDLDDYLGLFRGARPDQLIGEASTHYLSSAVAAERIAAARPDARILMMLRHPVEMIHSFHARRVYSGSEDLTRFEDALAAEEDRRRGRRIPASARNVAAFQYRALARYGEQVSRFFRHFPRSRIHAVIFEEFVTDPSVAYDGVISFLGLPPAAEVPVGRENIAPAVRSPRTHRLLHRPGAVRLAHAVLPALVRTRIRRLFERTSTEEAPRPPIDPTLRRELLDELSPDIEELGRLLDRDLATVWS